MVLAILVDSVLYYNKIHAGVTVAGQQVSRLTPDEAAARLNGVVDDMQKDSITLTYEGKSWEVFADDLGVAMDVEGAVAAAMDVSRAGNIFSDLGKRLKLYFTDVDVPLTGKMDDAKTNATLAKIATEIDVAPVNAALSMENGQIKAVQDQPGRAVDIDTLREQVRGVATTLHSTELAIPVKVVEAAVKADDTAEALAQAETMISAPIVLTSGDKKWTLSTQQIASYMGFTSKDVNGVSTLVPQLDAAKMEAFFTSIADEVATKPVNATFKSDGKKAWVVPGVPGKAIDPAATAVVVSETSLKATGRTVEVAVKTTDPDRTTEEAEAMGVKDLLATYSDSYGGTANRQHNVRITTEYASNVFLAPGEVYNFDKQIGPRTAARGYKTAPGIVGPGKLEDVYGGGICEVSTALFNAVFFAGLEVVERKNHSIYIDHYPKGRDATVSAGGPNLRFKNDTGHYIWIRGSSDGVTTTFNIYGTSEGRKVSYTTSDFYNFVSRTTVTIPNPSLPAGQKVVKTNGQQGKQCKVVRTVKLPDGTVVHKDTFISTWPMVPQQVEVGTASTTTTTKPSTTTTTGGNGNGGGSSTTTTTTPSTTNVTNW
ncbi:MAG: hypothetical protein GX595_10935 [Lentisphaerae bacterium]|nr:hypothetical protein [Lentisphaerota bacterium]